MLTLGQTTSISIVSKVPTIILGMSALFGFPEQSDVPSIATMVSSRRWPLISSYGASGRAPQPCLLRLLFATLIWQLHSWGQFMKIRDTLETSSSHGGMYAPGVISVPQLSRLKDKVSNFILVC
ncbi:hypothetical protein GOBAR_AA08002 [Gossypium barbadense]|uniref:Uncharacterized protein n=1 Tax=Gossypium barbadense TaxID=3634 RepID=A0A2P5YAR0_GOSBA|nr:hypothetical protein GOBAR_AA08002 [Gossypium barbadense]